MCTVRKNDVEEPSCARRSAGSTNKVCHRYVPYVDRRRTVLQRITVGGDEKIEAGGPADDSPASILFIMIETKLYASSVVPAGRLDGR